MKTEQKPLLPLAAIISGTTLAVFLFAWMAYVSIMKKYPPTFIEVWNRWDTVHFLFLARSGYTASGPQSVTIAFFPLYPMIVRAVAWIFWNKFLVAGLMVSQAAYAGACLAMYKLARLDETHETAIRSVAFFSIFPTAYFLHAAYPESLYLLLAMSSLYFARKGNWMLAGLLGGLTAMCKVCGVTMAAPLFVEYALQKQFRVKNIRPDILWLGLVPAGLAVHAYISYSVFNDAFAFVKVQLDHWHQRPVFPWQALWTTLKYMPQRPPDERIMLVLMETFFAFLGLGFTIYSFFRLRLSYAVYMLATWTLITSTFFWLSVSRHTLLLFPMFFLMGRLTKNPAADGAIITLSVLAYSMFLSQFVRFAWAF